MKLTALSLALQLPFYGKVPGEGGEQLQMSYPDMDSVPENYRGLYTQATDGTSVSLTGVVGVKTQADVNNVMGALTKERNDHAAAKTQLSAVLGGRSLEETQQLIDSIPALEAASQGQNVDELLQARLTQHTAPIQRNLDATIGERDVLAAQVKTLQLNEQRRVVGDSVSKGALETKMLPEAVADVQFMAQAIFEINESGQVVARDGIPGVTPGIAPEVWLADLKQKKPFYWPTSVGAGGRGNNGAPGIGDNPFTAENWDMTAQSLLAQKDMNKAKQMAAAAGTTLGGPKPALK